MKWVNKEVHLFINFRSDHTQKFFIIGVLENFAILTILATFFVELLAWLLQKLSAICRRIV